MKRCGKSAPRVRQRNRHGKPHREQDRIGTATRAVRHKRYGLRERCQARRPGRSLEATRKRSPRGMVVTSHSCKRAGPSRTRLTGRLILIHEGFGIRRRTPRHLWQPGSAPALPALPCGRHILPLLVDDDRSSVRGNVLDRAAPCIRVAATLAAVAIAATGCTAANNATSSQAEQPHQTMYGLSSDGPTTDLYTEFFGPRQPPPAPSVATADTQSVTAQPITPVQPTAATTRPARPGHAAPAMAANRTPQAVPQQSPPVQVAQEPAPPPAPQEPDVPVAYGITAKGPTTDLYTALFGRRDSQ